jgi:hypothetical protein
MEMMVEREGGRHLYTGEGSMAISDHAVFQLPYQHFTKRKKCVSLRLSASYTALWIDLLKKSSIGPRGV